MTWLIIVVGVSNIHTNIHEEDLKEKSKMSLEKRGNIATEANELLRRNKIGDPKWVRVQTHVQNHVQYHAQNRVAKNVNIANKNMSFLKIRDPKKRDFIVNEFLKTRQNIQQNVLSERVGDVSKQYELSKLQTSYRHANRIKERQG